MPPSLTVMRMKVEPASRLFSINSLRAEAGLWMILEYISLLKEVRRPTYFSSCDFVYEFRIQTANRFRFRRDNIWSHFWRLYEGGTNISIMRWKWSLVEIQIQSFQLERWLGRQVSKFEDSWIEWKALKRRDLVEWVVLSSNPNHEACYP